MMEQEINLVPIWGTKLNGFTRLIGESIVKKNVDIIKERDELRAVLKELKKILKPLGLARDPNHYINRERKANELLDEVLDD